MTEKFSISFEGRLASTVRKAAAQEGLSISAWLAEAAAVKARQRDLGDALDAFAEEHGKLLDDEVDAIIRRARKSSSVSRPRAGAGKAARPRRSKTAA